MHQIGRVVQQLQTRQYYLHLYLDALFAKDTHLTSDFADLQVCLVQYIVWSSDDRICNPGEAIC